MSPAENMTVEVAPHLGGAGSFQVVDRAEQGALVPITIVKTLFLVRHGEALHNIEEQKAKKAAAIKAEAQGLESGTQAHKDALEAARKSVLKAEWLRDAALSEAGKTQALLAKTELEELTSTSLGLPSPTRVLVSPLQRTLETAALLYPDHRTVQVCEELRERRTRLPCDTPSPPTNMMGRGLFSHMDFSGPVAERQDEGPMPVEDSSQLRERTGRFVQGLSKWEGDVLGLVTHKAFLRELERGPLGHSEATEFGCGEVRVYDVALAADGTVSAVLRHSRSQPWEPLATEEPHAGLAPQAGYSGCVPQSPPSAVARQPAVPCPDNMVQVF